MEILYKRNKNAKSNLKRAFTTVSTIAGAAGSVLAYTNTNKLTVL